MPKGEQLAYANSLWLIEQDEQKAKARTSLEQFIRYRNKTFLFKWYNEYIASRLDAFIRGEIKRLIIKMPPRRGKTQLTSRESPAFAFGINPNVSIIACSYGDTLAASNNRDVQRIIDSNEYRDIFPNTYLYGSMVRTTSKGSYLRNSSEFEIVDNKGYYKSAGVGGGITGRGFDLGFIDDYLKDAKEAESQTVRDSIWEWYTAVFYTRRMPDAGICVTATQWHEDDLIGRLERQMKADPMSDQWEIISFPEIIEHEADIHYPDPRSIGDVLHPERFSKEDVLLTKATLGTYWFNSLYQQRPTSREGNVFKRAWYDKRTTREEILSLNGQVDSVRVYWDLGASDNPNADQTAGCLMIKTKANQFIIFEVKAGRWNPHENKQQILRKCLEWNQLFPSVRVDIEAGIGLGVLYVDEIVRELISNGINAHKDPVNKSKYVRATPFIAASENKQITLCEGEWNEGFLLELSRLQLKTGDGYEFTGGHDDQMDSVANCFSKLQTSRQYGITFF